MADNRTGKIKFTDLAFSTGTADRFSSTCSYWSSVTGEERVYKISAVCHYCSYCSGACI